MFCQYPVLWRGKSDEQVQVEILTLLSICEAEDVSLCMPEPGLSSEAGDLQLPTLAAAPRTIAQWIKAPPGQWEKEDEHLRS